MQMHLPARCYGQRQQDTRPYIVPTGELVHFVSDRYGHHGDDPYDVDSVWQILADYGFSYHRLIDREGAEIELVPMRPKCLRAFHAGKSIWHGRPDANDWMIGTALLGMYGKPFTDRQYDKLIECIARDVQRWPGIRPENITGHEHVAPGRKPDPGPTFDWRRLDRGIAGLWEPN